jgi:hypothetical protein
VSKELDTSWFDLKKYDKLNELDLGGWCKQLTARHCLMSFCDDDVAERGIQVQRSGIKETPIIPKFNYEFFFRRKNTTHPFNTSSIESTTAFHIWTLREHKLDVWECCELRNFSGDNQGYFIHDKKKLRKLMDERRKLINEPIDLILKGSEMESRSHNLVVHLNATDEQIMKDFRHWLTEYRKAVEHEAHKRNFTDKDLREWVEYRVLPYLDLMLIAQLEGKSITQAQMARLIFPDEHTVDITDRLRRTTKTKAEWLFKDSTVQAIQAQL